MRTDTIQRIDEESNENSEDLPLIPPEDDEEVIQPFKDHKKAQLSTIAIIGLLCIFIFVTSTVLFGALYFKLLRSTSKPVWPKPSPSVLGEYSTAAVATDHEICSDIGRDILLRGGNAVDAAIASLVCIGVMDTQSAGLGGGHFMTIFNSTTKKCNVIDAREIAPLASFENMYKDEWNKSKYGWKSIAVPGEIHGLYTGYLNFGGKVPWKSLLEPTINLIDNGYPTSHALANSLKDFETIIYNEPTLKRFINPETNKIYKVGEQIKTRDNLSKTLKILANSDDPIKEFYHGNLTKLIIDEFINNNGIITEEDFNNYKSIIRDNDEIIYTKLNNNRYICGPPPPAGAAVTSSILNVLDDYNFDEKNLNNFDEYINLFHKFIEVSKFAYGIRSELGDVDYVNNSMNIAKNINTKKWSNYIQTKITDKVHPDKYYGGDFEIVQDHGTTSISVIDKDGNAVVVTSTINLIMGSLVMSESTGILWNDEMDDFSLPGHPNYFHLPPSPANFIKPGKRPMSSMSPIVIFNDKNKELLAIGAAGGSTIISGVATTALHSIWLKQDIKSSVDFPRLHNQLQPNYTVAETRMPVQYLNALKEKGHEFLVSDNYTVVTGIYRASDGAIYANSDFRKGSESEPSGY